MLGAITPSLDAPAAGEAAAPEAAAAAAEGAAAVEEISTEGYKAEARTNMCSILSGDTPIALTLEFLCRSNKTDLTILTQMKKSVEQRNSLYHSAIVLAHSLMSAGTTADSFLRDNLEWLSRATNWGKFTATATLGVIHRGHVKHIFPCLGGRFAGSVEHVFAVCHQPGAGAEGHCPVFTFQAIGIKRPRQNVVFAHAAPPLNCPQCF